MKREECLVVACGHGINDPLVSTLMLEYALKLQRERPRPMLFFTEEPDGQEASQEVLAKMAANGIKWCPMRYDVKGRQLLQRLRNTATFCLKSLAFARGAQRKTVVAFLSMPGSYASILRSLGFDHFVMVSFEPHSRYMLELGRWKQGTLKVRVAQYFEQRQLRNADVVVAPTIAAFRLIRQGGSPAHVVHQGVTIDVAANRRREVQRTVVRHKYGLDGCIVLCYAGKFNGLYYSEAEYARFMRMTCDMDPRVRHLIVTFPEHGGKLQELVASLGLGNRAVITGPVPPSELPDYLSASDMGVIAVPPTPSQVFRTPVKSALYWAAGLPIIIPEGISDDWQITRDHGVGLVIPDLLTIDESRFREWLEKVAQDGSGAIQRRCVEVALRYRDTSRMVEVLHDALDAAGDVPRT